MGTSISQSSPKTTNWNTVLACYKHSDISEYRIIKEIWRASDFQEKSISEGLKSNTLYYFYKAVKSNIEYTNALSQINDYIIRNSANSIYVELAKRSLLKTYQTDRPHRRWTALFFAEITNYYISRDASGFVGKKYRNQTIKDLIHFKKEISNKVQNIVKHGEKDIKSINQWKSFVEKSVNRLKKIDT